MRYESQFSIGQTVWMVRDERFSQIIKCAACKNTGKVRIAEEEHICPKCQGRAAHETYGGQKFYVYGSSTVGQVRIEDEPERYSKDEPNPKFQYMLYSTGVGSGQIWNQEHLFSSEEDAQRFCDAKNGLLPAHETEMGPRPVDSWGRVVPS